MQQPQATEGDDAVANQAQQQKSPASDKPAVVVPPTMKIARDLNNQDLIIVLYGMGGLGKSTTAYAAPIRKFAFRCGEGVIPPGGEYEDIDTIADFERVSKWFLDNPNHPYKMIVLDRADMLYWSEFKSDAGDARAEGRRAQGKFHPILFDKFLRIPSVIKVICVNERFQPADDKANRKQDTYTMNLAPATLKRLENMADIVGRVVKLQEGEDTSRIHTQRREVPYVQGKSNVPGLHNTLLRDLWKALGVERPDYKQGDGYDLKRLMHELNDTVGQKFFADSVYVRQLAVTSQLPVPTDPKDIPAWHALRDNLIPLMKQRIEQKTQSAPPAQKKEAA
jgi:hypothetical protein